jgi:hypothetical protein
MQRDNSIRNDACPVNFSALAQKKMETDADRGRTKLRLCGGNSAHPIGFIRRTQSADFATSLPNNRVGLSAGTSHL